MVILCWGLRIAYFTSKPQPSERNCTMYSPSVYRSDDTDQFYPSSLNANHACHDIDLALSAS